MPKHVIAEIGINHNGDIDKAKLLIKAAYDAGCDWVKFQKREIEYCYTEEDLQKPCDSPWGVTIEDKVRGRELDWNDFLALDKFCRAIGIGWSASCFDLVSLRRLHAMFPQRPFNKVASAMAMRETFVKETAEQGVFTFISTGLLKSLEDIFDCTRAFEEEKCPYVVMHCVPNYPAPTERLNLNFISVLKEEYLSGSVFKHCKGIGYSGHEISLMPSVVAASLGADYIERHITLDRAMYGADQSASVEPQGLIRLVRDVKQTEEILGEYDKVLYGDEKNPVPYFRDDV